ncbi:glycosyltransferase family 4 protein [Klebsiella variicola]|nr:glycosyltransferase family 1 protein [Klebsiella variicola]MCP5999274.1 glycosyltransferase family 4 protein [Klebsiella pneumoniae]HBZ7768175.1 glycosyltransferase family 4 protein [Klebsiella variicola subsp. variicola]ELN4237592.1 glycosyltransferase family 4 protein [Klebsiella variicola]ELQ4150870.1 glycosyltransferase family 4 protein [Klebsiella variicola]EMC8478506.1 glycosyltransferase family 4 protein [Klebsiella variicola]
MIYINARFLTQNMTGVQRFSYELCKELVKLRSDVVFLVPDKNTIKNSEAFDIFNIKEIRLGKGHIWEQITLPLFLKTKGQGGMLINLCNTAPILYRNQIATHHDITYIRYPKSFSKKFVFFYKVISSFFLKNSKKIITVSEFSKEEICSYYQIDKSKVTVVYNAAGIEFTSAGNKEVGYDEYLLAVSSPSYHKNFHGLINCFKQSDINIKLKIIGSAGSTFANTYNLDTSDQRVEFLGRVSDEELIKLYSNAKAFIFPSFYEGFGIPVIEAQKCGCPVLSSNKASMREVLSSSAIFFDPTSPEEINNCIIEIINNDKVRDDLILKGYQNADRFSWENSAIRLNKIINSFIE